MSKIGVSVSLDVTRIDKARLKEVTKKDGSVAKYLNLTTFINPTEEDQYQTLNAIVTGMSGRPVTIRTFDLSAENMPQSKNTRPNKSTNPLLGLRAVRLSLRQQRLFEIQLSAILRASVHGEIRILLPMVSSIHQVREVKKILRQIGRAHV